MSTVQLVIAVLILVLGLVLLGVLKSRGSRRSSSVLLVGPCGAGKTLLYYRLGQDEACETVSSMRPNETKLENEGLSLVDYPGHHRLRGHLGEELKRCVKIVFVVDASAMAQQAKPAAELLFQVLTSFQHKGPSMLLLCNKSDKATAKTPQRVKLMMMNEIETLRKTANTIQTIDDTTHTNGRSLGVDGQFFNFDLHSPCPVTFLACSIKNDELKPILDFIRAK